MWLTLRLPVSIKGEEFKTFLIFSSRKTKNYKSQKIKQGKRTQTLLFPIIKKYSRTHHWNYTMQDISVFYRPFLNNFLFVSISPAQRSQVNIHNGQKMKWLKSNLFFTDVTGKNQFASWNIARLRSKSYNYNIALKYHISLFNDKWYLKGPFNQMSCISV